MTIGIYCLQFKGTDKVYVGQSVNIEKRYQQHKYALKNEQAAKKLQKAYREYGMPTLLVLTESVITELDSLEQEAIILYNSINAGFNLSTDNSQPPRLRGENNGSSKFSNSQIEEAFLLLIDNPNMLISINNKKSYQK